MPYSEDPSDSKTFVKSIEIKEAEFIDQNPSMVHESQREAHEDAIKNKYAYSGHLSVECVLHYISDHLAKSMR